MVFLVVSPILFMGISYYLFPLITSISKFKSNISSLSVYL
jgi:hypothetical protein